MQTRKGDRVRLVEHGDKWTDLKPGDEGNVTFIDSLGTLHVTWDSGSRLGLIPGIDRWEVVPISKEDP